MRRKFIFIAILAVLMILAASVVFAGGQEGLKATGGVGIQAGTGYSWISFTASGTADDAKGMANARHVAADGTESAWQGTVTSIEQYSDNQVYFYGELTRADGLYEGKMYFLVEVTDNGEGDGSDADQIRARASVSPFSLGDVFTFSVPILEGNIQVH